MCKHSWLQTGIQPFHRQQGHRTREGCSGVGVAQSCKDTVPEPQSPSGEWAVPRHFHWPPFPLRIIPPFTNTQFSLPRQMPFTSTIPPTLLNFPLPPVEGVPRCKGGSAAPPPRRWGSKREACRHSRLGFGNGRLQSVWSLRLQTDELL